VKYVPLIHASFSSRATSSVQEAAAKLAQLHENDLVNFQASQKDLKIRKELENFPGNLAVSENE